VPHKRRLLQLGGRRSGLQQAHRIDWQLQFCAGPLLAVLARLFPPFAAAQPGFFHQHPLSLSAPFLFGLARSLTVTPFPRSLADTASARIWLTIVEVGHFEGGNQDHRKIHSLLYRGANTTGVGYQ
jgi:hypothetical protein